MKNTEINIDLEKDKRIKKEFNRLKKIYANLDANRYKVVEPLMENAAFMVVTMQDLQRAVNEAGAVIDVADCNGEMKRRRTAEMDTYIALQKNYLVTVKQLGTLCPAARNNSRLEMFVNDE